MDPRPHPPPSAPWVYDQPPVTGIPVPPQTITIYFNNSQPPPPSPPPQLPQTHVGTQWYTGLFDCCSDVPNCCMTCWCPCITFGRIAEIVGEGSTCNSCGVCGALYTLIAFTGCMCLYSCFYRSRIRRKYMLPETPWTDCFVHFFCECCALCQEHHELKNRGFDMSIGWQGNMERQNPGRTVAPNFQGGMWR